MVRALTIHYFITVRSSDSLLFCFSYYDDKGVSLIKSYIGAIKTNCQILAK